MSRFVRRFVVVAAGDATVLIPMLAKKSSESVEAAVVEAVVTDVASIGDCLRLARGVRGVTRGRGERDALGVSARRVGAGLDGLVDDVRAIFMREA